MKNKLKIPIYQVDAFADSIFSGNPAAVCPLENWLEDAIMQKIAMENNLSETAFFVKEKKGYHIRWFTPAVEVNLCGHATLATAHVLFNHLQIGVNMIEFNSRSGILKVRANGKQYIMDFPTDQISRQDPPDEIINSIGIRPESSWKGREDFMLVYEHQSIIENIKPDFKALAGSTGRGIIVTAPGRDVDFVSRFFAPQAGIDEDPVTGSAHTTLTPYWSERLDKKELKARQVSKRGGTVFCKYMNQRVEISGSANTYMSGEIILS